MSKISAYAAITDVEDDDLLVVVDVHDTTMAESGTTKKMTLAQLGALSASGGTMTGQLSPAVVSLTDGASIAVNAALGNDFRVTLGGNRALDAPSNPVDGQDITFLITQDGTGSRLLTWASGTGGYSFGSGGTPALSTAAGATDIVAFKYRAAAQLWLCLGSAAGF